jgi:hypothetical protein
MRKFQNTLSASRNAVKSFNQANLLLFSCQLLLHFSDFWEPNLKMHFIFKVSWNEIYSVL